MVFFNYALRKLNAKIVYYGPGLCGKTTNLQWIHDHFEGGQRGKMISLATEGDRTIFFDLLPIDIGTIRGMEVTLQLYTVPGQVHYNSTRQLVLRGADGVVFVADSQRTMQQSNEESFKNLEENLMLQGIELKDFPHVLQFNKRDLRDLQSVEELDSQLNAYRVPIFEAVATEGVGVQETLEGIVKLVMRSLRERYEPKMAPGPKPVGAPAPGGAPWPAPATTSPPSSTVPPTPPAPARTAPPPAPYAPPAATAPPSGGGAPFGSPDEPSIPDETPTDAVATGREEPAYPDGEITRDRRSDLLIDEPTGTDHLVDPIPDDAPAVSEPDDPTLTRRPVEDPEPDEGPGAPFEPPPEDPFEGGPPASPFGGDERDGTATDVGTLVPEEHEVLVGDDELEPLEPLEPLEDVDQPLEPLEPSSFEAENPPQEVEDTPVEFQDEIRAPSPFVRSSGAGADDTADFAQAWPPPPDATDQPPPADELEISGSWELESGDADVEKPPVAEATPEPEGGFGVDAAPHPTPESVESPPVSDVTPEPEPQGDSGIVEEDPEADSAPATPVAAPRGEHVDDLVASVLEDRKPTGRQEPAPRTTEVAPPAGASSTAPPWERARSEAPSEPVTFGDGDPFADEDEAVPTAEIVPSPAISGGSEPVSVQAHDNQLQLRLQGTGAIAESGQVRELDIQVPVPGSWVGNRRVTLQLRLTLMPAPEDEDDREG